MSTAFIPLRNDPNHRGVVDANYVRPAPREFPKMVYHASGLTKIVNSREEQNALGPSYGEVPVIKPSNWRAKLNEVHTRSGFRVYDYHLAFLKSNGVQVETLKEAAEFLDNLGPAEQEQFFEEAENGNPPDKTPTKAEAVSPEKPARKGK